MGFVEDADRLNLIYAAANMLVIPSLEDNQPQTGLEAMACGTPVVAFEAGGIPEFVRHEQTGLLARQADSSDLAEQMIRLALDSNLQRQMGESARAMMEMEFEVETQAWHHLKLYRDILKSDSRCHAGQVCRVQQPRKINGPPNLRVVSTTAGACNMITQLAQKLPVSHQPHHLPTE